MLYGSNSTLCQERLPPLSVIAFTISGRVSIIWRTRSRSRIGALSRMRNRHRSHSLFFNTKMDLLRFCPSNYRVPATVPCWGCSGLALALVVGETSEHRQASRSVAGSNRSAESHSRQSSPRRLKTDEILGGH